MEDVVTKGLKTKRVKKDKVAEEKPSKVKNLTAREKARKNQKGLVGAAIGAALGIMGTYFYMKKESPKA